MTSAGDQGAVAGSPADHGRRLYRHRADVARLVFNLILLAGCIALSELASSGLRAFGNDVLSLVGRLPRSLVEGLVGVTQLAAVVLPVVVVVLLVWRRRFVLLGLLVTAAGLAAGLMALLSRLTRDAVPVEEIGFDRFESWFIGGQFPSSAYLCGTTAVLVCASPWLPSRWRRAGWIFLAAAVAARILTATEVPIRIAVMLTLGAACGSLVLVVLGGPRRRIDVAAVATALAEVGLPAEDVRLTSPPDEVPTFAVTDAGGRSLTAAVHGRDQRDSDLLLEVWRGLTRRGLGDAPTIGSPLRAVEREALALGLFDAAGATVPTAVAVAETADEAAILVTEHPDGVLLADLPEDGIDDAVLAALWREVAPLQHRRMAHGDLNAHHVVVGGDRPTLVSPRRADVQASDEVLGADVAELLASLAALVGAERAVASAARALPPECLVRAVPLVQPAVFTRETRRAYKGEKQAVAELRNQLADVAGVDHVEVAPVSRITIKGVVSLVGSLVLGYYLISLASDWQDIWDAFADADLTYAVPIVVLTAGTYVTGSISLLGAVTTRLALLRTTAVMFGQSFLNRFTPANAGGMAMRIRYLQLNGLDTPVAAASVGLTSAASGIVQAVFIVVFLVWGGASDRFSDFEFPDIGTILIVVVAVGAVVSVVLYSRWGRRVVRPWVASSLHKITGDFGQLARSPGKLALLFGGAALGKLFTLTSFWLSVLAFGVDMSYPKAGALYMIANTIGSAVPTPGGVGGIEAALTAALISFGVDGGTAAGIVLFFRVLTFWLPTLPGYGFLQYTQRKGIV
ncbi:MAG TPA: lysylphosphatidylglycerol synthase transmembrane domain-containing protein [Acidimicrobiales bacterium]|nr:lysylphosphatidylglycerol synthase transmembrane domain-containing protein [Acidimicrobiales bacterium]